MEKNSVSAKRCDLGQCFFAFFFEPVNQNYFGAFFGGAILTTLPQVLTVFAEYEQLVLGAVMVLVMIFLREGVVPSILRKIRGSGE